MNTELTITPIAYNPDSKHWFARICHLPYAIWLDSGRPTSTSGRFDILSANPVCVLETFGEVTSIKYADGRSLESDEDPFALIKDLTPARANGPEVGSENHDLPFIGGVMGYFGYDLGRRLEKLPSFAAADLAMADMCVGIYPWAVIQDHQQQKAYLVINGTAAAHLHAPFNPANVKALLKPKSVQQDELIQKQLSASKPFALTAFKNDISKESYFSAIEKIQAYIRAGDCYQINFAQRFTAEYLGAPLEAYLLLRKYMSSPFSAFFKTKSGSILSFSPERFINVHAGCAVTQPIKGTIKRGASEQEDAQNAAWLESSAKNRAENVMIVDLLRNDLSKTCTHIQVPELCKLHSFANVHHLISTITAQLKPGITAIDVLRASFPGGSITGAPKIRAMEIIDELEPTRRSIYCGSLGYLSIDGQMDMNIAIRTLVCDQKKIYCWGGGGVVADSQAEDEYQESLSKVKLLMSTLEKYFLQ